MKKQQSGFTLIELIMVIVVLGILAAFALPRFANMGNDARLAALEGARASVMSANGIVHSTALARNETGSTGSVTLEGGNDVDTVHGYMAGTEVAVAAAVQLDGDFTVDDDSAATTSAGVVTITLGSCSFTYTQPAAAGDAGVVAVITGQNATEGGCDPS